MLPPPAASIEPDRRVAAPATRYISGHLKPFEQRSPGGVPGNLLRNVWLAFLLEPMYLEGALA